MCHAAHSVMKIWLACALITAAATVDAAEVDGNGDDEPGLPNIELLEFLGAFSTEEGEWIDPQSLLEEDIQMLIDMAARRMAGEQPANRRDETQNRKETQAIDND